MVMTSLLSTSLLSRASHAIVDLVAPAVAMPAPTSVIAPVFSGSPAAHVMWTTTVGVYGETSGCAKWDSPNRKPSPPGFGVVT